MHPSIFTLIFRVYSILDMERRGVERRRDKAKNIKEEKRGQDRLKMKQQKSEKEIEILKQESFEEC